MTDLVLNTTALIITSQEVQGKQVLEAGSRNVNGSVRSIIEQWSPESYIGIDMEDGPGVDQVCNIYDLVSEFGQDRFDVVMCMETLEHVEDWILAISNLKNVLKPGGIMIISVPSIGRKYHGYPHDYWRYEQKDFVKIFADMTILFSQKQRKSIIVKVQKTENFQEIELQHIHLFSINDMKRISQKDYVD